MPRTPQLDAALRRNKRKTVSKATIPAKTTSLRASLPGISARRMVSMAVEVELESAAEAGVIGNVIKASATALKSNFAVLIFPPVI